MGADLRSLYDPGVEVGRRTFTIFVKWGNIRCVEGVIMINVQKQLQGLGITFKPCSTRMRISHQARDLDEMELRRATASIATEIGNMEHTLILEAWGSHSVFVRGPTEKGGSACWMSSTSSSFPD